MKLQNVTDKADKKLASAGFTNSTFVVDGKLVAPGSSVEVEDNAVNRAEVAHLLKVGALVEVAETAPAPAVKVEVPTVTEEKATEDRSSKRGR